MNKNLLFFDTSALLNGAFFAFKNDNKYNNYDVAISYYSLSELEGIKTSANKSDEIKAKARKVVRELLAEPSDSFVIASNNENIYHKELRKNKLPDTHDCRIIIDAKQLNKYQNIIFITSDGCQFEIANFVFKNAEKIIFYEQKETLKEEYTGWIKITPTEEQFAALYSDMTNNIFNCEINQFAELYECGELKDILFWNGKEYRKIKYRNFVSPLGEKIAPRNVEQKMYLDLLQNKDVPVKMCVSKFGTGKSYLALSYALDEVGKGRFDKIVFVKNNLEAKGAGRLGTLPGNIAEKLEPWLKQIEDAIGTDLYNEYLATGVIEPAHLSGLRGRDIKNAILYVDEAENLTRQNIQLLLGRVGAGSEIILCGDWAQTDYVKEADSGLNFALSKLKGDPLFGMIRLVKTERSFVAALADKLDI